MMLIQCRSLNREWQPLPSEGMMMRASQILCSWHKTRYKAGSQGKQMGVDCVRFVCGVADEFLGLHSPAIRLPQDASFHAPDQGRQAVRKLLRLYWPMRAVQDNEPLQPLDLVIVGGGDHAGPGHAIIVGHKPRTLWQSNVGTGVTWTGFGLIDTYQTLHRIYRLVDMEQRWSRS